MNRVLFAILTTIAMGCSSSGNVGNADAGIYLPSVGGSSGEGGASSVTTLLAGASSVCTPGATQECLGAARCAGAQACDLDGAAWGPCDCGTGGIGGTGGASNTGGALSTAGAGATLGGTNSAGGMPAFSTTGGMPTVGFTSATGGAATTCQTGSLNCACYSNGACDPTLACGPSNICVFSGTGGGGTSAAGGAFGATGGARVTGGAAGTVCITGTLGCPCYTSGLCVAGATCGADKICVSNATGGGGALGSGGKAAVGGTSAAAGGVGAVGGFAITTATYPAMGGRPAAGGSLATGGTSAATSPVDKCAGLTLPTPTTASAGALSITSGYVMSGTLKGYGWVTYDSASTTAGTCAIPVCNSVGCSPAMASNGICGTGVVAADPTYNSSVLIGFSLNQASAGGADSLQPVQAPSSVTVYAHAGNSLGDQNLQVVLVAENGQSYCVDAGDWTTGQPIAIGDFNTKCSGNSGTALATGTNITQIMLVVPSEGANDSPFSVCLEGVVFGT